MRCQTAFQLATFIISAVLLLLYLFSGVIRTILLDIVPYALTTEDVAPTESPASDNAPTVIPKTIHQVYLGFDNEVMPAAWETARQSCIDLNPSYEYKLWTNESVVDFLATEYPWFLETWKGYRHHIQRADSIRYFLLAHYGGIYIDLDNGCRRSLDPLLRFPAWMPATSIRVGLTNHVMGTKRGHPYFRLLVERIQAYDHDYVFPYLTVMNSAGPHFVSMVWEEYMRTRPDDEELRILMQEEYKGNAWSFFTKEQGGGWYAWDHEVFGIAGRHMVLSGFAIAFFGCSIPLTIWWLGSMFARQIWMSAEEFTRSSGMLEWQKAD